MECVPIPRRLHPCRVHRGLALLAREAEVMQGFLAENDDSSAHHVHLSLFRSLRPLPVHVFGVLQASLHRLVRGSQLPFCHLVRFLNF